jgi:hypothetical protein
MDTPTIFYCYSGNHLIEDAVILPCCCQVIGCRSHILDLVTGNNLLCPKCGEKVTLTRIHSLPVLNESIQHFAEQLKTLERLGSLDDSRSGNDPISGPNDVSSRSDPSHHQKQEDTREVLSE